MRTAAALLLCSSGALGLLGPAPSLVRPGVLAPWSVHRAIMPVGSSRLPASGRLIMMAPPQSPKIIIAGAPASGKGTQCELIKEKYGVVHLSTGDMLREAVAAGTELGRQAKEYMDNGQLVPDELIIGVVQDRLAQADCAARGWLLDGFPRTRAQADALAASGIAPDAFVVLDVPDALLVERVVGRRADPVTGKIYHMTYFPPESDEVRARLVQRADDTEEKIAVRVAQFRAHCAAVAGCYAAVAVSVDGARAKEAVFADIAAAIDDVSAAVAVREAVVSETPLEPAPAAAAAAAAPSKWRRRGVGAASLAGFVVADMALKRAFRTAGIAFPASLFGMVALFAALCAAPARAAAAATAAAAPGAALLTLWLPVFFAPSLVTLPLSPPLSRAVVGKLALLITAGYAASLASTAAAVAALHGKSAAAAATDARDEAAAPAAAASAGWPVLTPRLLAKLAVSAGVTGAAAAAAAARDAVFCVQPLATASMLFATLGGYAGGALAPAAFRKVVHPVVTCTAVAWAAAAAQGAALGCGFGGALRAYVVGGAARGPLHLGAGDLLLGLLGPSIISFALQMHARRALMRENAGAVVGGTAFAAAAGLFGTAAAARALAVPPALRLAVVSRAITSPLAMAIAALLGADARLAVAIVVVTGVVGANFGARLLDALGVKDPVARGLAQGASAHGLGAAAMVNEPGAFPFAAIAMALTATFSTVMMSVPLLRRALLAVAGV